MTSGSTIDYEALAQEAMRGLVRNVLTRTAKSGLPGDHHFYVSFDTQAPGVALSKRLREKYPHEMTIVLQHRFWDLIVTEDRFEVKLTFDGIPERLVVPFSAIKVFFDPSVRYGLQFEEPDLGPDSGSATLHGLAQADTLETGPRLPGSRAPTTPPRKGRAPRSKPRSIDKEPVAPLTAGAAPPKQPAGPAPAPAPAKQPTPASAPAATAGDDENAKPPQQPGAGAQIVSLDAFRKK